MELTTRGEQPRESWTKQMLYEF